MGSPVDAKRNQGLIILYLASARAVAGREFACPRSVNCGTKGLAHTASRPQRVHSRSPSRAYPLRVHGTQPRKLIMEVKRCYLAPLRSHPRYCLPTVVDHTNKKHKRCPKEVVYFAMEKTLDGGSGCLAYVFLASRRAWHRRGTRPLQV